jgi:hypothetical protein
MRAVVAVVLVACSSTPKEPTITKEQQAGWCRPSVDHLIELLTSSDTGGVGMADRIRTALFEKCTVDKWGKDATDCFAKIATIDKAADCAKYLTVPQRDGFQQAIEGSAR